MLKQKIITVFIIVFVSIVTLATKANPLHVAARKCLYPSWWHELVFSHCKDDYHDETPLHAAVRHACSPSVVKRFIHPSSINAGTWRADETPLNVAMVYQSPERLAVIKALLEAGADPNVRTPLCKAARVDFLEAAEVLLQAGADPNAVHWGETPLHRARSSAMVKTLIRAGANPNARGSKGEAPLHTVAAIAPVTALTALLMAGANPNVTDNDGNTPLHVAAQKCFMHKTLELIAHGANEKAKDVQGRTFLDIAQFSCKEDGLQSLRLALKNFREQNEERGIYQQNHPQELHLYRTNLANFFDDLSREESDEKSS